MPEQQVCFFIEIHKNLRLLETSVVDSYVTLCLYFSK
ncbi:hypothetical protein BV129_00681 [Haemophilus influenzae]|uniref:Unnamed protein product n=1 Tax=Haemophilus influenzae (strain NTHi 3655) TaxID=375177 RepID=A0AAJ8WT33_HAEI3|nr:hypothetical protein BVZ85_00629 [Haemophilus influenzae]PRJ72843.1 hypothetical protein BV124_01718 [Haemophilus influenzae]PRJ81332.1 hypothetical protein BV151_00408 [Haemophilus influenzae]PRK45130.1 hypothetical protein BV185_00321 [Haemophilus influenzae]PRK48957.1 hypothetical protein BV182_01344 [Haemophilus influenzae]